MAPRRSSDRIAIKAQQKEEEDKQAEMEKQQEKERLAEIKKQEAEAKEKERQVIAEKRQKGKQGLAGTCQVRLITATNVIILFWSLIWLRLNEYDRSAFRPKTSCYSRKNTQPFLRKSNFISIFNLQSPTLQQFEGWQNLKILSGGRLNAFRNSLHSRLSVSTLRSSVIIH